MPQLKSEESPVHNELVSARQRMILIRVLLLLALVGGLLYLSRGLFIAATVNGQPITRLTVVSELERRGGSQTLEDLITKTLIFQEADKQNVTVSQEEVNKIVEEFEKSVKEQGQDVNTVLAFQGLDRARFIEQIRVQKIVEKILTPKVSISDEEIETHIKDNKQSLTEGASEDELREEARQQLRQTKLTDAFQSWMEELRKNANITYWVKY
ncbi:SurA N-terminal domain-containing protein [Candidatus Microgenomates bacterium]|nr:SurA N-terminal domain-containing protein [Candidatus Microgenomates bacterium]